MRAFLLRWALACTLIAAQTFTSAAAIMLPANPSWVPQGFNAGPPAPIVCNFAQGWYRNCDPGRITNTRSTTETCAGADGTYYTAAASTNCIGSGVGLNAWEARTNGIRNGTCAGGVAGSPGTLCTNWTAATTQSGLSRTIAGPSTESGLADVDIAYSGTSSGTAVSIDGETTTQVAATYGQTWTVSVFMYFNGAPTNVTSVNLLIRERQSGGGANNTNVSGSIPVLNAGPLGGQRFSYTATLSTASTAFVLPSIQLNFSSGISVSFDLRIGAYQLENNSLISPTVATYTVTNGGTGYLVNDTVTLATTGGTCTTSAVLKVTTVSVTTITATSTNTAFVCSTLPTSPVAQASTSGVGTGATFTLVPTNNAAQGFATPPIPTSGSAVTRNADVPSMAAIFGSSFTLYEAMTPAAPSTYSVNQIGVEVSDGTTTNRGNLARVLATGAGQQNGIGNVTGVNNSANGGSSIAVALAQNSVSKLSGTYTTTGTLSKISIGSREDGLIQWNGTIALVAINPNTALPASVIQQDTRLSLDLRCDGPMYARRCKVPAARDYARLATNDGEKVWRVAA
jgi:hypothetical protein